MGGSSSVLRRWLFGHCKYFWMCMYTECFCCGCCCSVCCYTAAAVVVAAVCCCCSSWYTCHPRVVIHTNSSIVVHTVNLFAVHTKIRWYTPRQYNCFCAASAYLCYIPLMVIAGMRGAAGGRQPPPRSPACIYIFSLVRQSRSKLPKNSYKSKNWALRTKKRKKEKKTSPIFFHSAMKTTMPILFHISQEPWSKASKPKCFACRWNQLRSARLTKKKMNPVQLFELGWI